jgi:hypothetical protein
MAKQYLNYVLLFATISVLESIGKVPNIGMVQGSELKEQLIQGF